MLHVLNAPSPAATAALPIGREILETLTGEKLAPVSSQLMSGRFARCRSPARSALPRPGFACFVGRPNAGKSTLTNALIGQKVAITSSRPQTTRHAIRGILHRPDAQLIVIDTPGLHKPRTLLGSRLNDVVRETWAEVDVIGFCVPADQPVGRGDEFIVDELQSVAGRTPVLGVVTKTDLARPEQVAERLTQLPALMEFAEVVPCSAVDGFQVGLLADLLVARLPEGPPLYPDGELTDEPEETLVAELVREAALEGVRDELPHSIAVVVRR